MIFYYSIVQAHFIYCKLNFIVPVPFLIKYYNTFFIITVFRLNSE